MHLAPVCRVLAAASMVLSAAATGTAAGHAAPGAPRTGSMAGSTAGSAAGSTAGSAAGSTAGSTTRSAASPALQAPAPALQAASPGDVDIVLGSVTPAIATPGPGARVTVRGTIHNSSAAAIPNPLVRIILGAEPLGSRDDVDAWALATGPAQGREVGRQQLTTPLTPGATAAFAVAINGAPSLRVSTYGALPLSIEVGVDSLRTFAGYQRVKQYEPLSLSWAVPLTLDPDAALFGPDGAARRQAWTTALGSGSRLDRVLTATQGTPMTWAVDPTLVPSLIPKSEDGKPADITAGKPDGPEATARGAVESRIRATAPSHSPWVLPDTDADIGAVADSGNAAGLTGSLVNRSAAVAKALGGRADIAWPADGRHTEARERALRGLYAGPGLAGQVADQGDLPGEGANTPAAGRRSPDGLPVLAFDHHLSSLLARTRSAGEAALSAQQFIASSVALLDERPGTARSVLAAAPRSFNPDPAAAAAFFTTIRAVPWLSGGTTSDVLADAAKAEPMRSDVARKPTPSPSTTGSPAVDPLASGAPVLTAQRGTDLEQDLRTVRGVALVRQDGDAFARTWTRAGEQLVSARWRTAPAAWSTLDAGIVAAARETTSSIKVSKRNINFLADTGRLQITVTNELDVGVENVKLSMEPANRRLRIDKQPPILRIGANSRATVVVDVTTLAAGPVPIRTTLTTPDGTVIGEGADVQVQVTPTGDWVYWTLGSVAGIILVLGIWRSVRRKPAPTRQATLKGDG